MMAARVSFQPDLTIGTPRKLFDWNAAWGPSWDLMPDGRRGITTIPVAEVKPVSALRIVQNWYAEFAASGGSARLP